MEVIQNITDFIASLLVALDNAIDWTLDGPLVALAWMLVFIGIPAFVGFIVFSLWTEHDLKKQTVQVKAMLSDNDTR